MNEKERLREQMGELQLQLDEIEDAERELEFEKLRDKFFMYSNSYGSGSRWPLYQKIIEKDGYYYRIKVQNDQQGRVEIDIEKLWSPETSGKAITEREYENGVSECLHAAHLFLAGDVPEYWK